MRSGAEIGKLVAIALVAGLLAACATGGGGAGTPMAVGPSDVPKLAGGWQGHASGVSGGGQPASLTIKPDGTYEMRVGAFSAAGTVQANEGRLLVTNTYTTGMPQEKRISEAVVSERNGRYVITGHGHTDRGPFSYVVSREK